LSAYLVSPTTPAVTLKKAPHSSKLVVMARKFKTRVVLQQRLLNVA
jgi:hypothetical protein